MAVTVPVITRARTRTSLHLTGSYHSIGVIKSSQTTCVLDVDNTPFFVFSHNQVREDWWSLVPHARTAVRAILRNEMQNGKFDRPLYPPFW